MAKRWISALERLVDSGRLGRGRRHARQGQVISVDEKKDGVMAKVQGSRRTPYKVTATADASSVYGKPDVDYEIAIKIIEQRKVK